MIFIELVVDSSGNENQSLKFNRNNKLWICMEFCGGGSLQDIYHGMYVMFSRAYRCFADIYFHIRLLYMVLKFSILNPKFRYTGYDRLELTGWEGPLH